ncbi:MAG TPA: ACP S-malonyltransferase, partial [bacterium]|nr:ACP S-malonyltransferase [bacterium]
MGEIMGKTAFVFPGQGAQYNGMAKDFADNYPKSRLAFEEANDRLGFDLKKIVMDGTPEELQQTMVTQPAILTASYSIMKAVEDSGIDCDYTAGLSLGEYNSLVKAEAMNFGDAVTVVRQRGTFMQEAVPSGIGGMAAVMGMEYEILKECLQEAQCEGIVEMANFNSPEQMVISGDLKAVESAVNIAGKKGAKRAVMLPVSAPFHSSLLKPAAERLQAVLMDTPVYPLQRSVVSNADAKVLNSEDEIVPSLV